MKIFIGLWSRLSVSAVGFLEIFPHAGEKRKKLKDLKFHILFPGIYFVHMHGSDGVNGDLKRVS